MPDNLQAKMIAIFDSILFFCLPAFFGSLFDPSPVLLSLSSYMKQVTAREAHETQALLSRLVCKSHLRGICLENTNFPISINLTAENQCARQT